MLGAPAKPLGGEGAAPQAAQRHASAHDSGSSSSGGSNAVAKVWKQEEEQLGVGPRVYGLVTWNVAGWRSALSAIKKDWGSLEVFLNRLECDVLCVQEAKTGVGQIRSNPKQVEATPRGWETFWSCCSAQQRRGLMGTGVTTFVRKGLTLRADSQPFSRLVGAAKASAAAAADSPAAQASAAAADSAAATKADGPVWADACTTTQMLSKFSKIRGFSCRQLQSTGAEPAAAAAAGSGGGPHAFLDLEGRALVTEHAGMTIINTYCPAGGCCYDRLAYKMHYLHGLRALMLQQRLLRRKPVVLMGDINATTSCKDVAPINATVNIRALWPPPSASPPPAAATAAEAAAAAGWTPCERLSPQLQRKLLRGGPLIERLLRDPNFYEIRHYPGWASKQQQQQQQRRGQSQQQQQQQPGPGRRRQDAWRFFLKPPGLRPRQIGRPFDTETEAHMRLSLDAWEVPINHETRTGTTSPPRPPAATAADAPAEGAAASVARDPGCSSKDQEDANCFRFVEKLPSVGEEGDKAAFLECTYSYMPDGEEGASWICKPANHLSLLHLSDCFNTVQVPLTDDELHQLYVHLGEPSHSPCVVQFMQSLLREEEMVDAFAAACSSGLSGAPSWVGAFTAWDQYTNKRYTNEARGLRIDFVLVDAELMGSLEPKPTPPPFQGLSLTERAMTEAQYKWAAAGAVQRATGGGLWVGAPKEGGGLQAALPLTLYNQGSREMQQTLNKCMGIVHSNSSLVYLSPLYSDHIAVRCVLRDPVEQQQQHYSSSGSGRCAGEAAAAGNKKGLLSSCSLDEDPATQKAQPHTKWCGLGQFLQPAAGRKAAAAGSSKQQQQQHKQQQQQKQQQLQQMHPLPRQQEQQHGPSPPTCSGGTQQPRSPAAAAAAAAATAAAGKIDVVVLEDSLSDCSEEEGPVVKRLRAEGKTGEKTGERQKIASLVEPVSDSLVTHIKESSSSTSSAHQPELKAACSNSSSSSQACGTPLPFTSRTPLAAARPAAAATAAAAASLASQPTHNRCAEGVLPGACQSKPCIEGKSNNNGSKRSSSSNKFGSKGKASADSSGGQADLRQFFALPKD
ncbi:hypothetical protein Esti_003813 [Eimeria stiedai]